MRFPTYPAAVARRIEEYPDPSRAFCGDWCLPGASQAPLFTTRHLIAVSTSSTHSRGFRVATLRDRLDDRFKDTSQEAVARLPRMVRGGYFFMHDFNSPESNHAI